MYEIAEKAKLRAAKLQEHNDFLKLQNETFERQLTRRMADNNELEFGLRDEKTAHTETKTALGTSEEGRTKALKDLKTAQNKIVVQR